MKRCYFCRTELHPGRVVGRQETCPACGRDLHICLNCRFYDPGAYNECHESQAERVLVKDRSNFCDYFRFRDAPAGDDPGNGKDDTRDKLEALFKK